jgi:formylglycine-generating enzyme required for sulfatase activity
MPSLKHAIRVFPRASIVLLFAAFALLCQENLYPQVAKTAQITAAGYPIRKLPDTGQTTDYTSTFGEDSDYKINAPSYTNNGNGTVTDNVTGLMWQQSDSGELTVEAAQVYCDTLTLGGYTDWRMPTSHELYGIINEDRLNPALDTLIFKKTVAEYWWSSDRRPDDSTRVWVVNAGGGIGPHPKSETISAGGTRHIHVRAVREMATPLTVTTHFLDNGDGTVTDRTTGLMWQKIQPTATMTWEQALSYCETFTLAGYSDWKLPNIKEIQSINDESKINPSVDKSVFSSFVAGKFWSSTSQYNAATKAWYMDFQYGIATYELKTVAMNVLCVRSNTVAAKDSVSEALIPGGEFDMGDHFGFVDPAHPSDETPVHKVKVNSFYMARFETTNQQFLTYLNASLLKGLVVVKNNAVCIAGGSDTLCYTYQYAPYYSIGYDGKTFSIMDFRANHPMVGVLWNGVAAYCNWLSLQNGLQECYNLGTWECDFTKNGFRLPTEAEWEYAGRGGHTNPYFNYPNGNTIDVTSVNLPNSGDPYETGSYPNTTPVGFYDGKLKLKSEYNWPGSASSYQTTNGANGFGLYDMQGNIWEFVNDWYGQNYYSLSPYDNPKGPTSGFIMPDGKPYRGMRGGNWYNGLVTNGVNDGHSRVSNRNPSYYRGPQDPNHPYYHLGFRVARNYVSTATGVHEIIETIPTQFRLCQNYPNPFNPTTTIEFRVSSFGFVSLKIFDVLGRDVATLVNEARTPGVYTVRWDASSLPSGVYFYRIQASDASTGSVNVETKKMLLTK